MAHRINPLTQADFYKTGHVFQYPNGTEQVYSNFTARSAKHAPVLGDFDEKIVWFGLQGFIKSFLIEAWNDNFFARPKAEVVNAYKRRLDNALGKGAVSVSHIEALHDLGYLPIEIKSLPEGSRVNMRVPAMTIVNTLPEFYWLTNYIETATSSELWKPSTVATIAYEYRRLLAYFAERTGAPLQFVDWQGHDFSSRGMSGVFDAMASGAGHLLSFCGTDSIASIDYLEKFYNADSDNEFVGGSVPATEHSVMCMGGEGDELGTFRRLITEIYPSGIASIVSDTWDFFKVITEFANVLKPEIMARGEDQYGNAKVVFRPDSGDPADILCGTLQGIPDFSHDASPAFGSLDQASDYIAYSLTTEEVAKRMGKTEPLGEAWSVDNEMIFRWEGVVYRIIVTTKKSIHAVISYSIKECNPAVLTPQEKGAVECLWEIFGGTVSEKGFKMLDSHVGLIYGDSITLAKADEILCRLHDKGFASSNTVFGIGSFTYQYVTRDTFGWAMKATAGIVNGEPRALSKDPKTDDGTKKSASGYLRVENVGDDFVLYDNQTLEESQYGELKTVFKNGRLLIDDSLSEIRARLLNYLA